MGMHKGMCGRYQNPPASTKNDFGKRGGQELYLRDYIARKKESDSFFDKPKLSYMDTINHPSFRVASNYVDKARTILKEIMTQEEAYGWIKAWASGAGDGSE